nr:4a-hydroxytetrahydrobiopterin dehydratase [Enterovirga sp. DB1703]
MPPGWSGDERRIAKIFTFASFPQAIAFMVEVAFFCEAANHHPDWTNTYRRVSVELTTHDAGRVTEKDLRLARHMDEVHGRLTGR